MADVFFEKGTSLSKSVDTVLLEANFKLLLGNSSILLNDGTVKENSVDLTITSPPYDNLRTYENKSIWNWDVFTKIANGLYKVTKKGGVVVWVVGDGTVNGSETGTSFRQALYFKEIGFRIHDTMIYLKSGSSFPSSNRYYQVFEYMFVFSKGAPKTINLIKDRKNRWGGTTSFGRISNRTKDGKLKKKGKVQIQDVGIRFNVWKINNGKGYSTKDEIAFQHPAIFPEQLAKDHIISWSNKGDTVLDPLMGSGTTGKMARLLGRKFIGIEMNENYFQLAKRRIFGV